MTNESETTAAPIPGSETIFVDISGQEDFPEGEKFTAEDAKKYMIKVQGGKLYLPVAPRVRWFRSEHPDWGIETKLLHLDQEFEFAVVQAIITNSTGRLMATGIKTQRGSKAGRDGFKDYVEKAESGSIGRALALLGYGTMAADIDEGSIVDSPINARPTYSGSSQGTTCKCGNVIPSARVTILTKQNKPINCMSCESKGG